MLIWNGSFWTTKKNRNLTIFEGPIRRLTQFLSPRKGFRLFGTRKTWGPLVSTGIPSGGGL